MSGSRSVFADSQEGRSWLFGRRWRTDRACGLSVHPVQAHGMGSTRTERLELRLTPEELEAWRAAAPGRNVSRWLRDLAARELAGVPTPSALAPATPESPPVTALPAAAPSSRAACPHPREHRRVHPWGTVCGDCGARVR